MTADGKKLRQQTRWKHDAALDADFWIRAFCDDVEKRAAALCGERFFHEMQRGRSDCPCAVCLGTAFEELKHKLLKPKGKQINPNKGDLT